MVEAEAWHLIERLTTDLLPLNESHPFEILVLGTPIELYDDEGDPTGEWSVHVGWRCWVLQEGHPSEWGHHMSIVSVGEYRTLDVLALHRIIERNYTDTVEQVRTWRTWDEVPRAAWN